MSDTNLAADTVILVAPDGMGEAAPALRHKLVNTYLQVIEAQGFLPAAICLYAEGVRLAVAGSPVLEELGALEAHGVPILLCKTCLDHLGLGAEVRVGRIGGMNDIVMAQMKASKVITI